MAADENASVYAYLDELDLAYIASAMCSEAYILPQWDKADALVAIKLYKRFLWLIFQYGSQHPIVPTKEIDEVWHNHILHTKQYHNDCQKIFGRYLHHMPSDGSEADTQQLAENFKKTRDLYFQEFNEPLPFYQHD
jgi:hypothetical protein